MSLYELWDRNGQWFARYINKAEAQAEADRRKDEGVTMHEVEAPDEK